MIITREKLSTYAESFLLLLDREKINSLEKVFGLVGHEFIFDGKIRHEIYITETKSKEKKPRAVSVSYSQSNVSDILIKYNFIQDICRQLVVKCDKPLEGYTVFTRDSFGNYGQYKFGEISNWEEVMEDLRELTRLK